MTYSPFRQLVRAEGARLYRDLPWRNTRDAYQIWLSEVMLQQTQVARVAVRWPEWLERFGDMHALAEAPVADVLAAWQGMGYNRRALALKAAAETVVREYDGEFPCETRELVALPGIGPATAQGIRSFAFDLPGVYLETNVRTVVLHHFFPDVPEVADRELAGLVEATCPAGAEGDIGPYAVPADARDTPRSWYYAMLDYGAWLKKTVPNPSRRSKGYARQSKFEGSRRQKRASIVRLLLDAHEVAVADGEADAVTGSEVLSLEQVTCALNEAEAAAGRDRVDEALVRSILENLVSEGFCVTVAEGWRIA